MQRWLPGAFAPKHSDNTSNDGVYGAFTRSRYAGFLYLNDDFRGGQIYFPQHDHSVQIKRKMLAFFPGDKHHAHGVKKIEEGCRYTLNMFYTYSNLHRDTLEQ
jgi:hypothetical protein